jgi:ceramide glucosyltransferase
MVWSARISAVNALLIAWLVTDCVATYGVWHYLRSLVPLVPAEASPRAVILVAIKGADDTTVRFLDRVCRQEYPNYRIVFALESRADLALGLVEATQQAAANRLEVDIVIAGYATQRTQKVHNLLAALGALRDGDRIVVFTDADTLLPTDWLTHLVRPIATGEVSASTGYRWPLPMDRHLPTLIGAAADLSVTTSARSRHWNMCWGGSTAVTREALNAIDLQAVWDRSASDDVTLTQALRAGGFTINSPLRVLVPSPVAFTWSGLFGFARRQHLMLRTYAPRHWLFGGMTLCIPAIGAVAALLSLADVNQFGIGALVASIAMLQVRLQIRRRIAARVLPADAQSSARGTIFFSSWAWPLIHFIHCVAFLSSCLGQRFTWAGIRYQLGGRNTLVVLRKDSREAK